MRDGKALCCGPFGFPAGRVRCKRGEVCGEVRLWTPGAHGRDADRPSVADPRRGSAIGLSRERAGATSPLCKRGASLRAHPEAETDSNHPLRGRSQGATDGRGAPNGRNRGTSGEVAGPARLPCSREWETSETRCENERPHVKARDLMSRRISPASRAMASVRRCSPRSRRRRPPSLRARRDLTTRTGRRAAVRRESGRAPTRGRPRTTRRAS